MNYDKYLEVKRDDEGNEVYYFRVPSQRGENKLLEVYQVTNSSLWAVQFNSGGKLPDALSGCWTTPQKTEAAVMAYITEKEAGLTTKKDK